MNVATTFAMPIASARVHEVDTVRGLMMVLMALGHARWFLFGYTPDPMDLSATWPSLFMLRWLTNIAAPGFVFLSGIGVFLRVSRRSRGEVARFLLSRGSLLVVLELTVVRFGWIPDPMATLFILQVIFAIGVSLIILAGLLWLPPVLVGTMGAILILTHPQLAGAAMAAGIPDSAVVVFLVGDATLAWPLGLSANVLYPVLPWAGAMLLGYGLGALFLRPPSQRASTLAIAGMAALTSFVLLRTLTGWGDPLPYDGTGGALAFLRVEKYPPSPLYLMATLGLVMLALAAFVGRPSRIVAPLTTLGRAPLFFYVFHLYALHAFGIVMAGLTFGFGSLGPPPAPSTPQWPLWAVLITFAAAMPLLYWPTRWFAGLKARGRFAVSGL